MRTEKMRQMNATFTKKRSCVREKCFAAKRLWLALKYISHDSFCHDARDVTGVCEWERDGRRQKFRMPNTRGTRKKRRVFFGWYFLMWLQRFVQIFDRHGGILEKTSTRLTSKISRVKSIKKIFSQLFYFFSLLVGIKKNEENWKRKRGWDSIKVKNP